MSAAATGGPEACFTCHMPQLSPVGLFRADGSGQAGRQPRSAQGLDPGDAAPVPSPETTDESADESAGILILPSKSDRPSDPFGWE